MKKLLIITALLITTITSYCQVTYGPSCTSSSTKSQTLEKVEITPAETRLYYYFHGNYWQGYFTIMQEATLKTNTGQVLRLIRCEGLDEGRGGYYIGHGAGKYNWVAVFPTIAPNTTVIDFESIIPASISEMMVGTSFSMLGIKLNANTTNNTPVSNAPTYANTNTLPVNSSVADEIMKFKKMMDAGIITQQEFEAQKRKLLDAK